MTNASSHPLRAGARTAFTVAALVAWFGVVLVTVLSATNSFAMEAPKGHLYGIGPRGFAGVVSRVSDTLSYFTMWSNIVVAVAFTVVARRPTLGSLPQRVLLTDALVMITVTGIVYAVLLAPQNHPTGWGVFTNPLQHIVVPIMTVLVWLVWGPRTWVRGRAVPLCLVIPGIWIVFMLIRGAMTGAYPYDFVDVPSRGYGPVAVILLIILAFGVALALAFWGIDRLLRRRT